jgi:para-nitrobenzyl esterase
MTPCGVRRDAHSPARSSNLTALLGLCFAAAMVVATPSATRAQAAATVSQLGAAVVRIDGGEIVGLTGADGAVARYLGVPYAAAPIGGLRWQPPQPVPPWQGMLETTHFAAACLQPLPAPGSFYQKEFFLTSERQSEDCLYLNLYTPARENTDRLPVMVWFHGGGFMQGSGSLPSFDGDALARKGVVLVTINYRLGPMGFFSHPELDAESPDHVSGNYGLLDMMAALRWVQANIAGFGGDAHNVTIFGQSAGALGVGAMMASPLARDLFRRAIVESDPMFGMNDPMQTLSQSEQGTAKFAEALRAHTIAELRMLPGPDLVRTIGVNGGKAAGFGLRPNVDGHVLPHDLPEMIASGQGNGETVLIGTTFDEGTQLLPATTPDGLNSLIHRRFGREADAIADLYKGSDDASATSAQDRMQSDYLLAASAREAFVLAAHGKPAYVYRFTRLAPGSDPIKVGAFHSGELAYVFGTQATIERPWQPRDGELAEQMQRYWTNFARAGDPNGAGLPSWPRFGAGSETVMELGDETRPISVLDAARKTAFDAYLTTRLPRQAGQ